MRDQDPRDLVNEDGELGTEHVDGVEFYHFATGLLDDGMRIINGLDYLASPELYENVEAWVLVSKHTYGSLTLVTEKTYYLSPDVYIKHGVYLIGYLRGDLLLGSSPAGMILSLDEYNEDPDKYIVKDIHLQVRFADSYMNLHNIPVHVYRALEHKPEYIVGTTYCVERKKDFEL